MRSWLRRRHWVRFGEPMRSSDLSDLVEMLASQAEFGPACHSVHLRVASHAGALYLDLADEQGQVVEMRPDGWSVVVDPPVHFVRPPGMGPLPVPVPGGTIEELRPFLNLDNEDAWILVVGALVAAVLLDVDPVVEMVTPIFTERAGDDLRGNRPVQPEHR